MSRRFYQRGAKLVARDLIGKILVRKIGRKVRRARIVETEAYVGQHDLASHSSRGRTARNEIMFGEAGHAYVYFIYGMYDMLNIVTSKVGDPQAVLIRAAEPLDGWRADLSGPGKICRALKITRAKDNGRDLLGDVMWFESDRSAKKSRVLRSRRINIDYAKEWIHAELRFYDARSKVVTKHPSKIKRGAVGATPARKSLRQKTSPPAQEDRAP